MTCALGMRAVTVESTMIVRTRSPTSAVSPPVRTRPTPCSRNSCTNSSVPWITDAMTSLGIKFLFLPMVEDKRILSTTPTHNKSSKFITMASCAIPFQTLKSPVFFQYMYASDDFVPAPSACMTIAIFSSPHKVSGTTLQKALGKRPLSMFLMAACTSPLSADTPRLSYRAASPPMGCALPDGLEGARGGCAAFWPAPASAHAGEAWPPVSAPSKLMDRTATYARSRASEGPGPTALTQSTFRPEVTIVSARRAPAADPRREMRFGFAPCVAPPLPFSMAPAASTARVPAWKTTTPGTTRARSRPQTTWPSSHAPG
mmetsp:Transcript_42414/g.128184  ORF Transcript_42414/g.128184 Transcript_42414/m.128184 type:complete len:316 (+) Transcript_42414:735-1682(+)